MLLRAAASASRLMFAASQYVCDMDLSNVPRTPSARHDSLRQTTTTQQRCEAFTSRLQTGPESGDETIAQNPVHTLFQTAATFTLTYDAPRAATALGSELVQPPQVACDAMGLRKQAASLDRTPRCGLLHEHRHDDDAWWHQARAACMFGLLHQLVALDPGAAAAAVAL
jgi:hypothetical protein